MSWSSRELADRLAAWADRGTGAVAFAIGGAEGLGAAVLDRADAVLSLQHLQGFPSTFAQSSVVVFLRLECHFDCALVLFFRDSQHRSPRAIHLQGEELAVGKIHNGIEILDSVIGKDIRFFRERSLYSIRCRRDGWACV